MCVYVFAAYHGRNVTCMYYINSFSCEFRGWGGGGGGSEGKGTGFTSDWKVERCVWGGGGGRKGGAEEAD